MAVSSSSIRSPIRSPIYSPTVGKWGAGTLSATSNGETVTVTGAQSVVYGADGIPLLIVPSGTAYITGGSVNPDTVDGLAVNGKMLNPQRRQAQGFDGRSSGYNSGNNVSYPIAVTAGDVVVIAKSRSTSISSDTERRKGCVEKYLVLHVMASAPADLDNYIAPAAIGWSGRGTPVGYTVDLDAACAALPSYDASTIDMPSFSTLIGYFGQHCPTMRMEDGTTPAAGYETLLPYQFGGDEGNYGRYTGSMIGVAGLALSLDAYSEAEKRQLFIWMLRHGVDALDPCEGDPAGGPDGGHFQYSFLTQAIAAYYTGRSSLLPDLATIDPTIHQLNQTFKMTALQLADCVPHSSSSKPHEFRRRTIASVSSLDIGLPTLYGGSAPTVNDPFRMAGLGYILTRESDAAQANVLTPSSQVVSPSGNYTWGIDVQPGSPFAVSDVVYFEPPYTLAVDQYHWSLRGITGYWSHFTAHTYGTGYRALNFFGDDVLALRALGIYDDAWDAMEGYVCAVNAGDYPSVSHAFPDMNDALTGASSETAIQDYWDAYATTIIPRLSGQTFSEDWSSYANGNTWTEVDADYTRSSTTVEVTIATDADAPGGLSASWGVTSNVHRWNYRDDIAAALAARTTERVQALMKVKLLSTSSARGGFGYSSGTNVHTGVLILRSGATDHRITIQVAGDPSTNTNSVVVVDSLNDGALYWIRMEIEGQYIRARHWIDGGSEGGTWTEYDNTTDIAVAFLGPTLRIGNPSHNFLFYSVGIGTDAPGPA